MGARAWALPAPDPSEPFHSALVEEMDLDLDLFDRGDERFHVPLDVRARDGPAWTQLLCSVRLLPLSLPVEELHLWPWGSLPLGPAQRPPQEFWAEVMAHLSRATQAGRSAPVAAPAPLPHPVATPAQRPTLGAAGPTQRRPTANQTAF